MACCLTQEQTILFHFLFYRPRVQPTLEAGQQDGEQVLGR
jgi:hypothetical protein